MAKTTKTATTPANIAFVGEKADLEALRVIADGMTTIKLPSDQNKPFFHKDALRIIKLFPRLYKSVKKIKK